MHFLGVGNGVVRYPVSPAVIPGQPEQDTAAGARNARRGGSVFEDVYLPEQRRRRKRQAALHSDTPRDCDAAGISTIYPAVDRTSASSFVGNFIDSYDHPQLLQTNPSTDI